MYCKSIAALVLMAAGFGASVAPAAEPPAPAPASAPTISDREAFFKEKLVDDYEQVGRRDPKWDAPARQLLQLAVKRWATPDAIDPNLDWQIVQAGDQAIAAGCDDPMVIYHYIRAGNSIGIDHGRLFLDPFAQNLVTSKYAPLLKIFAFVRLSEFFIDRLQGNAPEIMRRTLPRVYAYLPDALADPRGRTDVVQILIDLSERTARVDGDRKPSCDAMLAIMQKTLPDSAIPDYFEELFFTKYAWDARGNGFAPTVTDKGAQLFEERLGLAAKSFQQAVDKDPHFAEAWSEMLAVSLGLDQGRNEMEKYFKQAIAANPNLCSAYSKKLYYLTPKWHGSPDEQWEFGRACLQSGKWEARIPFLLLEAHAHLSESRWRELIPPNSTPQQRQQAREQAEQEFYQKLPVAWKDVTRLYEGYLARYPNAVFDRTRYAKLAFTTGHPQLAQKQLDLLGKEVVMPVFGSDTALSDFRAAVRSALEHPATAPVN